MSTLLNKAKRTEGSETEGIGKISRHKKDALKLKSIDVESILRTDEQTDRFHIFNFYEVLEPPPMFSNFKDGFIHFMITAAQHPQFVEGLLLKDATSKGKFPYVHYSVFNTKDGSFYHDPKWIHAIIEGHGNLQIHHQAGFAHLFSYMNSSPSWSPKLMANARDRIVYLIIVFKAEGNFDRLDEMWQKWSGADFIFHYLPRDARIGKMSLYKRCVPHGTFMYVFLCELKNGLQFFNSLLDLVERLNERSCGFASLYMIDEMF